MRVTNGVVCRAEHGDTDFIAYGCEIGQIGTGETKEGAIRSLEGTIKAAIELARGEDSIGLLNGQTVLPNDLMAEYQRVVIGKRNCAVRSITLGYGLRLQVYDLTDFDRSFESDGIA